MIAVSTLLNFIIRIILARDSEYPKKDTLEAGIRSKVNWISAL